MKLERRFTVEKQKIIYVLYQIDRLGHLVLEPFFLRNLYDENKFDITIITLPPHETPRVNKSVYEIMMRGLRTIHTNQFNLVSFGHKFDNILTYENYTCILLSAASLFKKFIETCKKMIYYYKLSEEDLEKGEKLREIFKIPKKAKIVTIHIRESGYLSGMKYHSYRDTDIDNYLPALEYLIKEGFYIIRLGNNTMKPLKIKHPQIIDMPFHPDYCEFVEPYFVAASSFYIGSSSGPAHLAQAFNIPVLATENIYTSYAWFTDKELHIFKKYYSNKLKRFLTLQEILLSPSLEFRRTEQFNNLGIELYSNTKEEILGAVKEMLSYIHGTHSLSEETVKINQLVEQMSEREKVALKRENKYGYSLTALPNISCEFIKANPYLLGHEI